MRTHAKRLLATAALGSPRGMTVFTYHRVSGTAHDELDVHPEAFRLQMLALREQGILVLPMDEAVAAMRRPEAVPSFVISFDDGFGDVYENAWPVLQDLRLPFTIFVTTACIDEGRMRWEGSTAREQGAPALRWGDLAEMVESGLCTIGNHTHTHARPELLDEVELDKAQSILRARIGVVPRHFAYTWGVPVPRMEGALRSRFDSAATGIVGRNDASTDPMLLRRVPVRRTDPLPFFEAKLRGNLGPERLYGHLVSSAKKLGIRG